MSKHTEQETYLLKCIDNLIEERDTLHEDVTTLEETVAHYEGELKAAQARINELEGDK